MARTKEFDPDQALQKALDVFWRHGYEAASLELLMQAMAISRQSLYDTFGDKRSLYFKSMALYRRQTNSSLRALFQQHASVYAAFQTIFNSMASETRAEHQRGCLLLSANLTRSLDDKELTRFLRSNQREVESIFRAAFEKAQERGEISAEKDPHALAKSFVATIQGMRALARLNHDRSELQHIADVALSTLK